MLRFGRSVEAVFSRLWGQLLKGPHRGRRIGWLGFVADPARLLERVVSGALVFVGAVEVLKS
jgi:hypothetical protein